jgi:hypothetical protein
MIAAGYKFESGERWLDVAVSTARNRSAFMARP